MATVNLGGFEDLVRSTLKNAVDTFGFSGVLSLLADEASERVNDDVEDTQLILDAIEACSEVVSALEGAEEAEDSDDEEEEFDQEDYLVEDDDEESEDDGDDEDEN